VNRQKRPNIIFLFADQLNYNSCGFSGETRAHTPNIDKLAAGGAVFQQATSCSPLCGPYRASLFTGKHVCSTGQFGNDIRMMPDNDAIGHVLDVAGYRTGYIGKWHLYCRNADEQFTPPGPYRLGFDQYFASYNWNHDYWNGYYYLDEEERIPMEGYQTDYQTNMAIDFIEKSAAKSKDSEPYALFVSYEVPHPPCTRSDVPASDYERFENLDFGDLLYARDEVFEEFDPSFNRDWQQENVIDIHQERCRAYFAMTASLDRNIGRIIESLERTGQLENTIIVFTSDHGDMLGGHGRVEKRIFFSESVRIPMVFYWKGQIAGGTKSDLPFNTPDISATLIDLVGAQIPASYEGASYRPFLLDEPKSGEFPEYAFISNMSYGNFNHNEEYRAVRSSEYLFVRMVREEREFFFHHACDSRELKNLIADPAHAVALESARRELERNMSILGDEFHTMEWYQGNWQKDGVVLSREERKTS
jgi:arylsulfatase A-like enzyme